MANQPPGPPTVGFTNQTIALDDLPTVDHTRFEPVARAYVWLRVGLVVVAAALALLALLLVPAALESAARSSTTEWAADFSIPDRPVVLAGIGVIVLAALVAWLNVIDAARMGFQIRTHDFSFRRGVLWRRVDTMPFARVQNVVIRRGPLERLFGIATLHLRSAGGSLFLAGLDADRAERLKALVVERAGELADGELAESAL